MTLAHADTSPARVVLVEDNEDDRLWVEDIFESSLEQYTLDTFTRGSTALQSFTDGSASCIILDYRLPSEDGITLLAEFKKIDPFVPVILLTGQGNEELASASIKLGAADYLVKQNMDARSLGPAIENAIKHAALKQKISVQAEEQRNYLEILIHDLRAPLRNLHALSELAIEDAEAGNFDELKKSLLLKSDMSKRAIDLISSVEIYALLDGNVGFGPVYLSEVAHSAKANLAGVISDKSAVVTIDELPVIAGHAPQLMQLLQNLILNGLKYNDSDTPEITIGDVQIEAQTVTFSVSDNGIGMPDDAEQRVFKPFVRLWNHQNYEGSGLGLAICAKVVKRHGGRIWCTSAEGAGSQFHLSFPVVTR